MATYFIGDIQGCFDEFNLLLKKISFNPRCDTLYLAGDLIGRGPKSLEVLTFLVEHQESIKPVLGNHDLHFLSIANQIKKAKVSDRFEALLASPRLNELVDYLRQQPLIIDLPDFNIVLSHAGISPQWNVEQAMIHAQRVSEQLKGRDYLSLLAEMYQHPGDDWTQCHSHLEKMIFTINSLTRMRYCYANGRLDFSQNSAPSENNNPSLAPWFHFTPHNNAYTYVFGHWASLMGETNSSQFCALDTGCLWGNHLSAWHYEKNQLTTQQHLS